MDPTPPTPMVILTLLVPVQAQERVVDLLLAAGTPAGEPEIEFSLHPVAAHGPLVRMAPGEEEVRGSARRTELKLILSRTRCEALLPPLRALLGGRDGGFWVTPLERFERFAEPAPAGGTPRGDA